MAKTKYEVGDRIVYQGRQFEVYRVTMRRGRDRHLQALYGLRATYRKSAKSKARGYTYAQATASRMKRASE